MLVDAVILAGGQSSRLGSVAKASLRVGGQSLLERTVDAALSAARRCVVVGPFAPNAFAAPEYASAVFTTREDPPFSGPAAAVAAGVRQLVPTSPTESGAEESSTVVSSTAVCDCVLVLACDMPGIAAQVPVLVAALASAPVGVEGALAVDAARQLQPLAGLYRRQSLVDAVSRFSETDLVGLSMRKLIEPLSVVQVATPPGATDDVDTWDDAVRLGATPPTTVNMNKRSTR